MSAGEDGTVLIAGGGIGGLAAALALANRGRRASVVEQAAEFREIGAGIQFGPNGFKIMERLGLRDAANDLAVFPDDLILMDGVTEEEITRIPVGPAFRERFAHPYALIHRADPAAGLLEACRKASLITFHPGRRVEGFEDEGRRVRVRTTAGGGEVEVLEGAALIGADGLWSRTREAIVGDGRPRVSGHVAYRAVLPIEAVPEAFRRNAMILWAGPKNHLVQYPLRGGKLFNLVAVFHSDRYEQGWDTRGDPEELHARFAGNCATVRALLDRIESWRMWVLCDRDPVRHWSRGRATLLGDAAHPMLQYLAQGACMALEDAVVLADALDADADVAAAFQNYEAARYLRAGRCQMTARLYGEFYHAEGVKRELRNGMLGNRSPEASFESVAWLYDGV